MGSEVTPFERREWYENVPSVLCIVSLNYVCVRF